jgi:dolichol-phosphate mannosyltransferase
MGGQPPFGSAHARGRRAVQPDRRTNQSAERETRSHGERLNLHVAEILSRPLEKVGRVGQGTSSPEFDPHVLLECEHFNDEVLVGIPVRHPLVDHPEPRPLFRDHAAHLPLHTAREDRRPMQEAVGALGRRSAQPARDAAGPQNPSGDLRARAPQIFERESLLMTGPVRGVVHQSPHTTPMECQTPNSKSAYRRLDEQQPVPVIESGPGLSIVIPAWNEEDRLPRTLARYLPALEARGEPFEVIVVADGVRDHTADAARQFVSRGVRVLEFPQKLGKGGAILEGLRAARYERIGYVDADGPIAPSEIYGMVDSLRDVDCVVASRWTRGSVVLRAEPLFNRVAGRVWNFLVRATLFLPIRDTQCGAKFFKRSVVVPILRTITVTNRAFDVVFLFHVRKAGGRVKEVPVTWTHDPDTRMPVGRAIPVMFASLVAVRMMNTSISRRVPSRWVVWFHQRYGPQ